MFLSTPETPIRPNWPKISAPQATQKENAVLGNFLTHSSQNYNGAQGAFR